MADCNEGQQAAEGFTTAMRVILSVPPDRAATIRQSIRPARPARDGGQSSPRKSDGDRRSEKSPA